MSRDFPSLHRPFDARRPWDRRSSAPVLAVFLTKTAKHLAVIACFLIIGHATGRYEAGPNSIMLLVACAAVVHSAGRALRRRVTLRLRTSHDRRAS